MPFLCFNYSQWVKEKWLTSTAIQSKTNLSCSRQETTNDLGDGPPVMLSRLGKRSDYMTRLGKRSDYMTRLGRSYMTRLGKRSADYMTRLGKRPNYMTRLGKRSSNYLTRLGKRSGPISSQPGEDLVRRIIYFNPGRGTFMMEIPNQMNYVFPPFFTSDNSGSDFTLNFRSRDKVRRASLACNLWYNEIWEEVWSHDPQKRI